MHELSMRRYEIRNGPSIHSSGDASRVSRENRQRHQGTALNTPDGASLRPVIKGVSEIGAGVPLGRGHGEYWMCFDEGYSRELEGF